MGVARYVRDRDRPESAEVAVAVADGWQGNGVGTLLLRRLVDRAREEGIRRFTALMLADNEPMAHLLGGIGETRVLDAGQGAVELAVALPQSDWAPARGLVAIGRPRRDAPAGGARSGVVPRSTAAVSGRWRASPRHRSSLLRQQME